MKVKDIDVFGWKNAIIGMRKSWDSVNKSDSTFGVCNNLIVGDNDKKLILKLCKAGPSHRKFLRLIHIQANIIAPFYWWTEMDTYKIGTTRLSSSTMHTIAKRDLNKSDFEFDHYGEIEKKIVNLVNVYIDEYKNHKTINNLRKLKQVLPASYLYDSIFDFNYETFLNMHKYREDHKLREWQQFINTIILNTPMMKEILNAINGTTERRT